MDIYRGRSDNPTDSKQPSGYIDNWEDAVARWNDGAMLHFDGTIDKDGTRHTDLWIRINEDDVIALFDALVRAYQERALLFKTFDTQPPDHFLEGAEKIWRSFLNTGIRLGRMTHGPRTK